ncbi:hypothetical protein JL722_5782 [Aureococcus anophagefferens]|nr:hypothetical protein JL722_5782 [Aureococcus anophagefferens]
MGNCRAEAKGGCCVLVWAGFDIAFGIIGMVMSFVIMALSVGLRVQPFGALAFPLLFAGLLSLVSASMVACCQFRHRAVAGAALLAGLLAFISLCLLGGDHTPCAEATCAGWDWWSDEDRRLGEARRPRGLEENDGDLWALTNGGSICGNDGSGPTRWGTWYDEDFDDREEDDHARPAAQIAPAANVQLIPAQNVQMVPATNIFAPADARRARRESMRRVVGLAVARAGRGRRAARRRRRSRATTMTASLRALAAADPTSLDLSASEALMCTNLMCEHVGDRCGCKLALWLERRAPSLEALSLRANDLRRARRRLPPRGAADPGPRRQ